MDVAKNSSGRDAALSITIREMLPGEADSLYKLARQSFSPIESLGASKPKQALIAMAGDAIAGAIFLKIFPGKDGKKTGYLDLAFVTKEHRGKGVGNRLYPAATQWLRDAGCDIVAAMVKDDNIASWGLLEKQGYQQLGFLDYLRIFGLGAGFMLWLRTIFCIACGMNFWCDQPATPKRSIPEMAVFLGLNMGLLLLRQCVRLLRGIPWAWPQVAAGLFCLCLVIAMGWLGTVLAKGKWRFGLTRGGLLITILLMLMGTFFPLLGRWYPEGRDKAPVRRKALGIQATTLWAVLLGVFLAARLLFPAVAFWESVASNLMIFLIFHIWALYPFEYFGGKRVFDWQPLLYGGLAIASALALFIL